MLFCSFAFAQKSYESWFKIFDERNKYSTNVRSYHRRERHFRVNNLNLVRALRMIGGTSTKPITDSLQKKFISLHICLFSKNLFIFMKKATDYLFNMKNLTIVNACLIERYIIKNLSPIMFASVPALEYRNSYYGHFVSGEEYLSRASSSNIR